MRQKLLKIYLPFLAVSIGFIGLYTFLNWLLIIRLELFQLKDGIVQFALPAIISIVFVLFVLRKRIKLFKIAPNGHDFYCFLCGLFLFTPVIIAQTYVENKEGELTEVASPSQLDNSKASLFYSIKHAKTLNALGGGHYTNTSVGRNGSEICITCYFVCPLIDQNTKDTSALGKYKTWIGVVFSEKFSNRVFDNKEKQQKDIDSFINRSISKYQTYKYQTHFLKNISKDDNREDYYAAINRTTCHADKKDLIVLREERGSYETRTGDELNYFIGFFIFTNLVWLVLVLATPLNKTELKKIHSAKEREKRKREWKDILNIFVPSREVWATPIIFDINISVFLLMFFTGAGFLQCESQVLLQWGGNFKPLVVEGQWWRLLTSVFVHCGFLHLLYNMLALLLICLFLETIIGSKKFMIIYLITGIVSGYVSLMYHGDVVSVGASGAIFGMFGVLAGLMVIQHVDKKLTAAIWIFLAIYIGINLVMSLQGGVDMAAHVGGLASGFLIGIVYFPIEKYFLKKRNE